MSLAEIRPVMILDRQTRHLSGKLRALSARTTLLMLFFVLGAARSEAAELKQNTLQAWEAYVQTSKLAMQQRAAGRRPFLWVDESPDRLRRLRSGELVVSNRDHAEVPSGLIHHWVGAMFLPGVTLDEVNAVFNDYDHYPDFYRPRVLRVNVLKQTNGLSENNHVGGPEGLRGDRCRGGRQQSPHHQTGHLQGIQLEHRHARAGDR